MAPTQRDPWLDNSKMVLVAFVVIGHAWGLLEKTQGSHWAYDFLYLWHIPAFVLHQRLPRPSRSSGTGAG